MSEFGEALLNDVRKELNSSVTTDRKLKAIAKRIADSTDFVDAGDYAVRIGELLSEALVSNTSGMAYISKEVADELLRPLLTQTHDMVAESCKAVVTNMNKSIGVGVGTSVADLNTSRIDGLINKVASYPTMEEAQWILKEPIINYAQSVVDESIEKTAKTSNSLGLKSYIVREAEPTAYKSVRRGKRTYKYKVPCRWCADLEGKYEYRGNGSNVPQDVYRRHEGCRCRVNLIRDKRAQDVWSKQWTDADANQMSDRIKERTQAQQTAERAEQRERKRTLSNVDYVSVHTGYSARGAAMLLDVYKNEVRQNGLEWLIDMVNNERR